jgi:hypothetical protein
MRSFVSPFLLPGLFVVASCEHHPTEPATGELAATPVMSDVNGANGHVTGGGIVRLDGYIGGEVVEVRFTAGFSLHCDNAPVSYLVISWRGNLWTLEEGSLENVTCLDEPDVSPAPPLAFFDTFIANAFGDLRLLRGPSISGSYISFVLQDAGEPGGKNDKAGFAIWEPGADPAVDEPVVIVPFDYTAGGNIQAHAN